MTSGGEPSSIYDWAVPGNLQPEPITLEVWRNLPEEFCREVELVNGQAVRCEKPSRAHQAAASRLGSPRAPGARLARVKSTAAVVASRGAALTIERFDLGEPAPGEIAVRIAATGVCRTDLHIRDGGYPVPEFPVIPGHEGAGVVTAVGSAPAGSRASLNMSSLLNGRTVRGTIQGDADARTLVPHLIELYRQGRFPVGRLVRHYRFAEIKRAIDDMEAGQAIKPILRMTDGGKDRA